MYNDTLTDFINRINNALRANKEQLEVRKSKTVLAVAEIFKKKGIISDIKSKNLSLLLHLSPEASQWTDMKFISKPSHRYYISYRDIPFPKSPKGFYVISTSKGVMTHTDARKAKIGGELICEVW